MFQKPPGLQVCIKGFWRNPTSGFVSPLMVCQQHMPQLLPRGEAFPGGTLHHTSRVCFGGPPLAELSRWEPAFQGPLGVHLSNKGSLTHHCLILYWSTKRQRMPGWRKAAAQFTTFPYNMVTCYLQYLKVVLTTWIEMDWHICPSVCVCV